MSPIIHCTFIFGSVGFLCFVQPCFPFFLAVLSFISWSTLLNCLYIFLFVAVRLQEKKRKEEKRMWTYLKIKGRKTNRNSVSICLFFFAFVFRFRRSIPSCLSFYRTFYPVLYHSVLCSRRSVLPSLSLYHLSKSSGPHLVSVQVELIIAL